MKYKDEKADLDVNGEVLKVESVPLFIDSADTAYVEIVNSGSHEAMSAQEGSAHFEETITFTVEGEGGIGDEIVEHARTFLDEEYQYILGAKYAEVEDDTNFYYYYIRSEDRTVIFREDEEEWHYFSGNERITLDHEDADFHRDIERGRPAMDCSGFAQRVYEEVGYDFPLNEMSSNHLENHFENQDEAEVGGLMYIEPRANSNIPHVVIVTEV